MASFITALKRRADSDLLLAIRNSDLCRAAKLFQDGLDVDTRFLLNSYKQPALCLCVENNDFQMVELLLQFGASVNQTDSTGLTALHIASEYGYLGLAEHLLKCRSNSNAKNILGRSPLHLVPSSGNKDLAKLLISFGANVNSTDIFHQTPLHLAAQGTNSEIVLALLEAGANPQAKDKGGNTALHFAADSLLSDTETISVLSSYFPWAAFFPNAQKRTPLHIIVGTGRKCAVEALRQILSNVPFNKLSSPSFAVSPRTDIGHTPLHLAVLERNAGLVRVLIASGSQMDIRDNLGRTPLDLAVGFEDWEIVAILLAAGAPTRKLVDRGVFSLIRDERIREMLLHVSLHPPRLSSLCRRVITTTTGPPFQGNLRHMPKLLQDFLSFEAL